MNNTEVKDALDSCWADLSAVKLLIDGLGITSKIVPYLTKYAVIRACGSIEQAFKAVIADHCAYRSKKQVKRFLDKRVRSNSANPSYSKICEILHDFDADWKTSFKESVNAEPDKARLVTSLQSLVDARNDFAHGGNPSASIADVLSYFDDARQVIVKLDIVVAT